MQERFGVSDALLSQLRRQLSQENQRPHLTSTLSVHATDVPAEIGDPCRRGAAAERRLVLGARGDVVVVRGSSPAVSLIERRAAGRGAAKDADRAEGVETLSIGDAAASGGGHQARRTT